ncbi:hypothetical protein [Mesorhizobium sp.]|uniref:hypothetical protein n=1 Tax=Mesorhizobium sp. TaxID=1871066 RepID=UPI000FE94CF5|nr:hypothetical protein [Mesorhizobium sp.]RWK76265.1 MAG: hypothetical protein EOR50_14820 [Mesorhizobium sp.]RWK81020.1 MAG: hypothetical protein EOR51_16360 [Mesorhizobium sp.]RWL08341.1 MAG: hypothetical protein EOR55_04075 [Mesorhizobium sp.]RWL12140.1 MAG: hypothetical protein EOR56_15025 [Mesorhizobium sp.]
MPSIADSYEMIGRILAKLILGGLRRQDMKATDILGGDIDFEARRHFSDVVIWLLTEGLVTRASLYTDGTFVGLQLTSKGIAAIEKGTFQGPSGASIRETVEAKPDGGLGSDTYGKIGSFVGGLLGGFAQSAS